MKDQFNEETNSFSEKDRKVCEDYIDHTPQWCGDCYACSNCGIIFITKSSELSRHLAYKEMLVKLGEEMKRKLEECSGDNKCNGCESMMACEVLEQDRQFNQAISDYQNIIRSN